MLRMAIIMVIGFAMAGMPAVEHPLDVEADAQNKVFTWFDSLGYSSFSGCPFVRLTIGWQQIGDEPKTPVTIDGFLVKDVGSIIGLDLRVHDLGRMMLDQNVQAEALYQVLDLPAEARAVLARREKNEDEDRWRGFGDHLNQRTQIFILARGCASHGHAELAKELFRFAASLPDMNQGKDGPRPLAADLADDIANADMWQAVLDFGDPKISWSGLLTRFERFCADFPHSRHRPRAEEVTGILRKMIVEDEAHNPVDLQQFKLMSVPDQVRELVFLLRNQRGQQWSQPGSCDIFLDPAGERSPAARLVAMGYDAVPQLIAVIGDERFTRSVGYWRDFCFSHYVLRVGDCAVAILERIAGQDFQGKDPAAVRVAVEAWWADFQRLGERQVMINAVQSGDHTAGERAKRLSQQYPEECLSAIFSGLDAAKDVWTRRTLIEVLGDFPGPASEPLLLQRLEHDPDLRVRLSAAEALQKRHDARALPAMISEWRRLTEKDEAQDDLIGFLVESGSAEAITAIASTWSGHSIDQRIEVISVLVRMSAGTSDDYPLAVESLLAQALTDTMERTGMQLGWGDASFSDPRVCDLAAYVLSKHHPDRYAFDSTATPDEKERQRLVCLNVWHHAHGLAELPLPELRHEATIPLDQVQPAINRLLACTNPQQRAAAMPAILALGLPALAHVRVARDHEPDGPGRAALEQIATTLAATVAVVELAEPLRGDRQLVELTDALRGHQLRAEDVVVVLTCGVRHLPETVAGFDFIASRDGMGSGMKVTITAVDHKIKQLGSQKGWDKLCRVQAGRKELYNSSGCLSLDYAASAEAYQDLTKHVAKAVGEAPETPIYIRVRVAREE